MSPPRDALARGAERLAAAGIESARLDARVLFAHATYPLRPIASLGTPPPQAGEDNKARTSLSSPACGGGGSRATASEPEGVSREALARFDGFLARRIAREPVAYITGTKEFWSLALAVGPGVLVPRPETETLIDEMLREFPDRAAPLRVVDFGTGSGAILAAVLTEFPGARGIGLDSSPRALAWARRNLERYGERCELAAADWADAPNTSFDVILSNPPYLTTAEVESAAPELAYEPRGALDGGPDGLAAYRALAPLIAARLKPDGRAFLEVGAGQGPAVAAILAACGLEILRIAPDLAGIPRCVVAVPEKTVGKVRASL
jgi:release factor glutamine methyltransferase